MKKIKVPHVYKHLAGVAYDCGWTITQTGSGHLRWTAPDGRSCFTPSSPGDNHGGLIRVTAKLRRAGLPVGKKGHGT